MVTLTIDGHEVQAEEGMNLLQVARGIGIDIPTLCYHEAVTPYGACRLCVVEVIRRGRSSVSASCTYPVENGIEVRTDSPRALRARRMVVELLLARCPNVEVIRDLADKMGIEKPRFQEEEGEDCILCGLCVRVCQEVVGESVLGFINRGVERTITTPFDTPSEKCIGCGACALVCPTGAIKIEGEDQIVHSELSLGPSSAIYVPILQAVPKTPVIDIESCIHFLTGECRFCEQVCEPRAIDYSMEEETLELDVGTIVLATGYQPFDASRDNKYGYGRHDNVLTGPEFEKLVHSSGPTGGKIMLRDGRAPKSVAVVHCVGSRDEDHNVYCSRVCCMYSLKLAHLVKENTDATVCEVYKDLRAFGKGYEEFYNRVEEEGVTFIHGDVNAVERQNGKLVVTCEDTFFGQPDRIDVDMVILGVGMEPQQDAGDVAAQFGISRSDDGFFLEKHPKLAPVETASDGIFLAGTAQGPKDIPDTVAQAGAAAAAALAMMDRGLVSIEPFTPLVADLRCVGCGLCVEVCPFQAIDLVERRLFENVAEVDETLCKGCGLCVSACRGKALSLRGFDDRQLLAEMGALLAVA